MGSSGSTYRLIWSLPLKITGNFRHPDESTVEFDVTHSGKTYTVVGKLVRLFLNEQYFTYFFYVKGQNGIVNKKFERLAQNRQAGSKENAIKEIYELSTLRLLTRGVDVNVMNKILKTGSFLLAKGKNQYDFPYFRRYILGTEKRCSGGLSAKLLDNNSFERVYDKLSPISYGSWNFELVRTIEPSKRVKLW